MLKLLLGKDEKPSCHAEECGRPRWHRCPFSTESATAQDFLMDGIIYVMCTTNLSELAGRYVMTNRDTAAMCCAKLGVRIEIC